MFVFRSDDFAAFRRYSGEFARILEKLQYHVFASTGSLKHTMLPKALSLRRDNAIDTMLQPIHWIVWRKTGTVRGPVFANGRALILVGFGFWNLEFRVVDHDISEAVAVKNVKHRRDGSVKDAG